MCEESLLAYVFGRTARIGTEWGKAGMTLSSVPSEVFAELARTQPSAGRLRRHCVPDSTRVDMLLLKSLLVRVERRSVACWPLWCASASSRDWAMLERAERADAAAVRDVVDYPMTGAWLAEALAAPDGPAFERHLAHLGGVAVAAAVRAGLPGRWHAHTCPRASWRCLASACCAARRAASV